MMRKRWKGMVIMVKKIVVWLFVAGMMCTAFSAMAEVPVDLPYEGYGYNTWGEAVPYPNSYKVVKTISGEDLGCGDLNEPDKLYVDGNRRIYLSDTGNARILVLDADFQLIREIKGYLHNG